MSIETAAEISEAARQHGAKPVAVFVDENFADIVRCCKAAGIGTAQLHGKGARASLPDLPNWLEVSDLVTYFKTLQSFPGLAKAAHLPMSFADCRKEDWPPSI